MRTALRSTGVLFCLTGCVYGAWASRIPATQERLGLSAGALALVLLAVEAGAMAGLAVGAAAVRRAGCRRALQLGFAGFPAGLALTGVAPTATVLMAAAAAMAASNSVIDVAMNAQGAELEERTGEPQLGRLHAGHSLGVLAGGAGGTAAAAAGAALATHFTIVALATAVAAQLAARNLPPGTRGAPAARIGFPGPRLRSLGAIAFCAFAAESGASSWAGVHLRTVHEATPVVASAAFTGLALALGAGRLVGDRLVALWGRWRIVQGGALVAAGGGLLAVTAPGLGGAAAGWMLLGLGIAPVAPAVLGAAASAAPGAPAGGVAAVSALGYAGAFATPPLVGSLAGPAGLPVALATLVLAALGAAALACVARLAAPKPDYQPEHGALTGETPGTARCPEQESNLRPTP